MEKPESELTSLELRQKAQKLVDEAAALPKERIGGGSRRPARRNGYMNWQPLARVRTGNEATPEASICGTLLGDAASRRVLHHTARAAGDAAPT